MMAVREMRHLRDRHLFSNTFKNIDNPAVPTMAFKKKCFPFFINDIINSGIFKTSTVVPSSMFNK